MGLRTSIALTSGVSSVAIALAAPAAAQAVSSTGVTQTDVINFYRVPAGADRTFGTVSTDTEIGGAARATARITCATGCASPGGIVQEAASSAGPATNRIEIEGAQRIIASAQADGASAKADAEIDSGIHQLASGTEASNGIVNSGELAIGADAEAIASELDANAFAAITLGLGLESYTGSLGSASISNGGVIDILANAAASAPGAATATAYLSLGISQIAAPTASAAVDFYNQGSISLGSIASAQGLEAVAQGFVITGISTSAMTTSRDENSNDPASAAFANAGDIDVAAIAMAGGVDSAVAAATVVAGLSQYATTPWGGDASAALTNDGSLAVAATAEAVAASAVAQAEVANGLQQWSYSSGRGSAAAVANNSGSIKVNADAAAHGASALAVAQLSQGFNQIASGRHGANAATAELTNGGSIEIGAHAIATGGDATAAADLGYGVVQEGSLIAGVGGQSGAASAAIVNDGSIDIAASATALASGVATSTGIGIPGQGAPTGTGLAFASMGFGLMQSAGGFSSAEANITNSGSINIGAEAAASANLLAAASAYIGVGMAQTATAQRSNLDGTISGAASAELANSGTIGIGAEAVAQVLSGTATASAIAFVEQGLAQTAVGGTGAAVSLAQGSDAALNITADAEALAMNASAVAAAFNGIVQAAGATAGDTANAAVSLNNAGSLNIGADAQAMTLFAGKPFDFGSSAYAQSFVSRGINQLAIGRGTNGGDGSVSLTNAGHLNIGVGAEAAGGKAQAIAVISGGIEQNAIGHDAASARLTNSGSLGVGAEAAASGYRTAVATAVVEQAIRQVAGVYLDGSDSAAAIGNSGSLTIGVDAQAGASHGAAIAVAGLGAGIVQGASAEDHAGVTLTNGGDLNILVDGAAVAADTGIAVAIMSQGVFQSAYAATGTDGVASAQITNAGMFNVALNASAAAGDTAVASAALLQTGIAQLASGDRIGTASTLISNSGSMDIALSASAAAGDDATASAILARGIYQFALAGQDASVALENDEDISITGSAVAVAGNAAGAGATANASASIVAVEQFAAAMTGISGSATGPDGTMLYNQVFGPSGTATAALTNSGTIELASVASAKGDDQATARAEITPLKQTASGDGALTLIENAGALDIGATASAVAQTGALAAAFNNGIMQYVSGMGTMIATAVGPDGGMTNVVASLAEGDVAATVANSGSMDITSTAQALSTGGQLPDGEPSPTGAAIGTFAVAGAYIAGAINQAGRGSNVDLTVDNSGSLTATSRAVASAEDTAGAQAGGTAIHQNGFATEQQITAVFDSSGNYIAGSTATSAAGRASFTVDNSGTIALSVEAGALSDGYGRADATATGIIQTGRGEVVASALVNSADIDVVSKAAASGTNAWGSAIAHVLIQKYSVATDEVRNTVDNSGSISVSAHGVAIATDTANAAGIALGFSQAGVSGEFIEEKFSNTGALTVEAGANADGGGFAGLTAWGIGIQQSGVVYLADGDASAQIDNQGSFDVHSVGKATARDFSNPTAVADGAIQAAFGGSGGSADIGFINGGEFDITAAAIAEGDIDTHATGFANGVIQYAVAGETASVAAENSGAFNVAASIDVTLSNGEDAGNLASGTAAFAGLYQSALAASSGSALDFPTDGGSVLSRFKLGAGFAEASLGNSGSIALTADAMVAGDAAWSSGIALADQGITQAAFGKQAAVLLINDGSIHIAANADVSVEGNAFAFAGQPIIGNAPIEQYATAAAFGTKVIQTALGGLSSESYGMVVGPAAISLVNSGSIAIGGNADAVSANELARAEVVLQGVFQEARGTEAAVVFDNSGNLALGGSAASDGETAYTRLQVKAAINQDGRGFDYRTVVRIGPDGEFGIDTEVGFVGTPELSVNNSGTIAMLAEGSAVADETATAIALAQSGVMQVPIGDGYMGRLTIANTGHIVAITNAAATGRVASAGAQSDRIVMQAGRSSNFSNEGSLEAVAEAVATGQISAFAQGQSSAVAQGMDQLSDVAIVSNKGVIAANASAEATADDEGNASVESRAILQGGDDGDVVEARFVNEGDVMVSGSARATAKEQGGIASATAANQGYTFRASTGEVTVDNSGLLSVTADAIADADAGLGLAVAGGITLAAIGSREFTPAGDISNPGSLSGSVVNSGDIIVAAQASGTVGTIVVPDPVEPGPRSAGGGPAVQETEVEFGGATAAAVGIFVASNSNDLTIANRGLLQVTAITKEGGTATAAGIEFFDNHDAAGNADDILRIVNDGGTIIAAVSTDGGDTYRHGNAVDLHNAPNATVIDLLGDGSIYGNIDVLAGDVITVAGGETSLDGAINPGGELEGRLTIASDGTLYLRDNPLSDMYDGPSKSNVESFMMAEGATLAVEVPWSADEDYVQIVAGTAHIDGTLEVRRVMGGLWTDKTVLDNLIDANELSGKFDDVNLLGAGILLKAAVDYDDTGNVDLVITRTAFGAVGGETRNQRAVAAGIENVYDPGLTGPFASLLSQFFVLDQDGYYDALDQVGGAQYASLSGQLSRSSTLLDMALSDHLDCAVRGGAVDRCEAPESKVKLWAFGGANISRADSTDNVGGLHGDGSLLLVGADALFDRAMVGAFTGYRTFDMSFDRHNGKVSAEGLQVGVHGSYDTGAFYGRGIASYSALAGKSERDIALGAIVGTARSKPDFKLLSIYGEVGARIAIGASWLTPFVAIDHQRVSVSSFAETGVDGANLAADDQNDSSTSAIAGVKWAGNWGGLVPELKLAYRYEPSDPERSFQLRFDDAPAGSHFGIIDDRWSRGSLVAGAGIGAVLARSVSGKLTYQGSFASGQNDHSIIGSIRIGFGGGTK